MKNSSKRVLTVTSIIVVLSLAAVLYFTVVLPKIRTAGQNPEPSLPPAQATAIQPTLEATGQALPPTQATAPNLQPSTGIKVNPIDGLAPDFIMGADVSMLAQIEASGGKYYVNGVEEDCLQILKDHGVNWIRLRIWNDPTDASGKPLGGGNNDLARTVEMAKRAKALGFKFLLDFHYSDWWADPGKQDKPKAWENLNTEQLQQAVYDYTASVIQTLASANATPDMVEIGNEVNDGMLWPDGRITGLGSGKVGGFDGFANLLKQGIRAVRDNDPNNDKPDQHIKVVIHLANGGKNDLYRTVFDALTERDVDYDIIGLSYYSYWHGTLDQLKANMNDISVRYQKDVVIAETAYAFTTEDADGHGNLFGEGAQISGGYKATLQGQATSVHDVIEAVAQVPDGRGLGIFYWEPDWIPVAGAGWKSGEGNAWENQAMFDFKGSALPTINVFNLVRPGEGKTYVPAKMTGIYPININTHLQEMPALPEAVQADFDDDSIRSLPVEWETIQPEKLQYNGTFTLKGTMAGTDQMASAQILVSGEKSLVENPGFETGEFTAWVVEGDADAVDISGEAQNIHDGKFALHYWKNDPFTFTLTQKISGLENGSYSLSAWMHGGGGEESIQLFASGYGGDTLTANIELTGWQAWKNPTIQNIQVTNGECTIGLKVVAQAGNWAFFDDVYLAKGK
jgi:arabinogalactan endo-1,4-beta-galactosidase